MTCTSCRIANMECDCADGPCPDCDERLYGPPENTTLPDPSLISCDYAAVELRVLAAAAIKNPDLDLVVLDVYGTDVRTVVDTQADRKKQLAALYGACLGDKPNEPR